MKSTELSKFLFLLTLFHMHGQLGSADFEFDDSNVTLLHELTNDSLQLNTHEVLLSKPVKKKPYAILDKPSDYVKIPVVKAYNGHTVAFDFNLGDLEDVHDTILPDGDLSSEERHLLRNTNDEDLTYSEDSLLISSTVSTYVTPMSTESSTSTTTTTTDKPTTTTTTEMPTTLSPMLSSTEAPAMTSTEMVTSTPGPVDLASAHIYKILSKTKSKNKVIHEFAQKDEQLKTFGNHFNSISTFFGVTEDNSTSDALTSSVNVFQLMVNLYDHFFWQPSEIRTKVSPACGVGLRSYITALNSNSDWAQKAYDSSGHYRGQLFFGNNKWLGERQFCLEVNRNPFEEERKNLQFEFYVATIHIAVWVPSNLTAEIQLGLCLPNTCTTRDVEAVLYQDPHAQMLTNALAFNNNTHINIKSVRTVSGQYCVWRDVKFIILIIFCIMLAGVVLAATWYESELNEKKRLCQISYNGKADPKIGVNPDFHGKDFEVYQMSQMSSTADSNIVSDVNKNTKYSTKQITISEIKPESTGGGVVVKQPSSDVNANTVDYSCEIKKDLGIHREIFLCFAFQRNVETIFSMDLKSENQTSCIHGLRVMAVLWTIMVHTYLQMFAIGENRFVRVITERSFIYQFVGNATFSVDMFFFISGFLAVLLFLKHDKDKKRTNTDGDGFMRRSLKESCLIVLYRYIRLSPTYLFVILFTELSLRHTLDTSVFQATVDIQTCTDYWWRNILYINNFFPLNQLCMIWSWYMANDMQFYIMATLLLVFSTRYYKSTILILLAILVSSWGVSGVVSIHYNYTHKVANPFESFNFLYDKPWQRVGTYIVGMIAGYLVFVNKTPPKISFRLNLILWAASLGLIFVIVCGVWSGQLNVIATAFYVGIGHTAFGVGLVWVVLSCCWGLANPVNKVLSYPGILPLSRLTYCAYLIHPTIMMLTSFQMEGAVHLNNVLILTVFLGNAVVSFAAAFLISVFFEAPVVRLLRIFFKK